MKTISYSALIFTFMWVMAYLSIGFATLQLNLINWSEKLRSVIALYFFVTLLFRVIGAGFYILTRENDNSK